MRGYAAWHELFWTTAEKFGNDDPCSMIRWLAADGLLNFADDVEVEDDEVQEVK